MNMSRTETVENLVNEAHNGDLVEIVLTKDREWLLGTKEAEFNPYNRGQEGFMLQVATSEKLKSEKQEAKPYPLNGVTGYFGFDWYEAITLSPCLNVIDHPIGYRFEHQRISDVNRAGNVIAVPDEAIASYRIIERYTPRA